MKNLLFYLATLLLFPSSLLITEAPWKEIDQGLFYKEFKAHLKSEYSDSKVSVLKIDPEYYNFNLINAKEYKQYSKTAKEWCTEKNQIAAINAGMYRLDHLTNVGYMKNFNFLNNSKLNNDNTILAFNRKDASVPEIQIIDRQCQSWDELKEKYNSFTQSIRMIDCNQKNKWSQQTKRWSIAVIAIDKEGKVLFIICRSPYSVHNFINIMLKLPLNIKNAMYLEGGPEASFYLNHKGTELQKFGSYETGFNEDDLNNSYWEIPNLIGITKK